MSSLLKSFILIVCILFGVYIYNPEYYERILSSFDASIDSATKRINNPTSRLKMEERKFVEKISLTKDLIVTISKDITKIKSEIKDSELQLDAGKKNYELELNKFNLENNQLSDSEIQVFKNKKEFLLFTKSSIEKKKNLLSSWEDKKSKLLESIPVLKSNLELLSTYIKDIEQREKLSEISGGKYENIENVNKNITSVIKQIDDTVQSYDSEEKAIMEIQKTENTYKLSEKISNINDLKLGF